MRLEWGQPPARASRVGLEPLAATADLARASAQRHPVEYRQVLMDLALEPWDQELLLLEKAREPAQPV